MRNGAHFRSLQIQEGAEWGRVKGRKVHRVGGVETRGNNEPRDSVRAWSLRVAHSVYCWTAGVP